MPTANEAREHFELREALESQSARLCAARSTFRQRMELRRLAAHVDALYEGLSAQGLKDESAHTVSKYHVHLHVGIAECARSELLKSEIQKNHVLILNWLRNTTTARTILPPNFHRDLISVIVEGEPQEAAEVMQEHVKYELNSILLAMELFQGKNWQVKH